jgi:hypothetical protein
MIQRLAAILVALMLPVQGMGVPHSHAGEGASDPEGHAARPHFHLHGHLHHQHNHDDRDGGHHRHTGSSYDDDGASHPVPSHDDSAINVANEVPLHASDRVETTPLDHIDWLATATETSFQSALIARVPSDRPPDPGGGCPLYLQQLSLLI